MKQMIFEKAGFCLLCVVLAAGFGACGIRETASSAESNGSVADVEDTNAASSSSTSAGNAVEDAIMHVPVVDEKTDLSSCVRVGTYKGLQLTKRVQKVTETDVIAQIRDSMDPEEVSDPDAKAKKGDTVNIAYSGRTDGRTFEGGSNDSYDLVLGSGTFIDGFEDGVIGMKKGETKDLYLTFPKNYAGEMAGKKAVFTVTVRAIKRKPALTDAWVNAYTNGAYTSVQDYEKYIKETMEKQNEDQAQQTMRSDAWTQIEADSEFYRLPKSYVDQKKKEFKNGVEAEAEQYGLSLKEFREKAGLSKSEYNKQEDRYGKLQAANRVLLEAIAEKENIKTNSQEYQGAIKKLENNSGTTVDKLISQAGKEAVREYVLSQIVMDRVIKYADVQEEIMSVSSTSDNN